MNWQSFHIDLPMARIAAIEAGDGPNVLLCLHGYEQRKDLFKPLFEPLLEGWRFVAIDLPLYGETEWFERDRPLDEAFLEALWSGFAERYAGSRLHLLGFSMGGKVALSLQSSVRRRAESLILLAPDSDQSNFWHWLIRTPLGLHLNAWLDRNPQWVLRPASWLFKIGLLDKLSYKVVKLSYETAAFRERKTRQLQLYDPLRINRARLQADLETSFHLIWGKKDKILPARFAKQVSQLLKLESFQLLDAGHMMIDENTSLVQTALFPILQDLSTKAVDK